MLVIAAGSGVGSFGIQIARAMGCRVIATAGTEKKRAKAIEFGAELAIDHYNDDIVAAVREATNGRGVDVALDHVGTPVIAAVFGLDEIAEAHRLMESSADRPWPPVAPETGSGFHAGMVFEYHRHPRAGEVLTATVADGEEWTKQGRRGGDLRFREIVTTLSMLMGSRASPPGGSM